MKKQVVWGVAGLLLGLSVCARADVNNDMDNFFNQLGFASNSSQPQVWQGQAAGYMSGGSLYARTAVRQVQLVSMALPDINAGCGGIDAYLGSFSFINGEQLQRFAKQIMSNAAGYFFDLALQTTVPEMKQAKDFLQKMASDINSMNLSSCQAAQGIVGGLFPRTQVSQQKVCQDIAGESNVFAYWAASRQGCTVGGKMGEVQDKASEKDRERVLKNINIMWNALGKSRMFDGNKELKEFVMTLTGSLIFGPDGDIQPLPPRTTDQDMIKAMMEGGTAKIYHCNDAENCLKVAASTDVIIRRDKALKSQIIQLLSSIQNKADSDTPLTEKEKGFISSTSVPVFTYLVDPQMLGISNTVVYQLSDYIGYDILLQYMQELVQQARGMLAAGNYPQQVVDTRLENLNQATAMIASFQARVQVQQDALLVVERQMSYMRQQVSSRMLTRYQNNYHFDGGQ
ncbi:MAG: conjugal transfer pilus assembly protein TraH [Sodalis sp. (in: enterobacteria)]|uniref:conjugal transfer pilus assembly protein TraH n=1 Tax=Sodalis sp. (in: enterobacteria) TaxID=1898979 RepID=UPI0039E2C4CC